MAEPQGTFKKSCLFCRHTAQQQQNQDLNVITLKPPMVGPSQAQAKTIIDHSSGLKSMSGSTEYCKEGGFRDKTDQSGGR